MTLYKPTAKPLAMYSTESSLHTTQLSIFQRSYNCSFPNKLCIQEYSLITQLHNKDRPVLYDATGSHCLSTEWHCL